MDGSNDVHKFCMGPWRGADVESLTCHNTHASVCVCVCTFGVGRPPFTFARRNVDISPAAIFSTVFIVSMGVQYFGTFSSCRLSTDKIYLRPLLL